jgi:hypothetical protein
VTPDRHKEIQASIIRATSWLLSPLDLTKPNQSISTIGLYQMIRHIPRDDFIHVLKNMDGVHFLDTGTQLDVQIPSKYFI